MASVAGAVQVFSPSQEFLDGECVAAPGLYEARLPESLITASAVPLQMPSSALLSVAAFRAQFNRVFASAPSLGRPMSELTFTGWRYQWKAGRIEPIAIEWKRASTLNWPVLIRRTWWATYTEDLPIDIFGWPEIWSAGRKTSRPLSVS
jgi:hypothetical protein